jgi:hypothetical protein
MALKLVGSNEFEVGMGNPDADDFNTGHIANVFSFVSQECGLVLVSPYLGGLSTG